MPRPRSEDRRNAILSAGTRVIASQGLAAPTVAIAKEAGVSNGSLFVYFDTKAALLNELYVSLKTEMTAAATAGLDAGGEPREQVRRMWTQWVRWATSNPEKRRALAQLEVADDITADSHRTVRAAFRGIADLLERSRASGPMQDAPLGFVLALTNAIAETTIDAVIREPTEAGALSSVAFDAIWRVLAGPAVPVTT
jgi:AcrR family transcriptional regulator